LKQKTLNFGYKDNYSFKNLYKSTCNEVAINYINEWPNTSINTKIFCIYGPLGSGKTHISKVWMEKSNALIFNNIKDLSFNHFNKFDRNLIFEDVAPNKNWPENLLFEFINEIKSSSLSLLITCNSDPLKLKWKTKDLISRFTSFTNIEIKLPDDFLIKKLLIKQFADRQLSLDGEQIEYISKRIERSYSSIIEIVDRIDNLALQHKKAISKYVIKEAIKSL
jgi:chromosomal replication initiation ATPase DnaA